MQLFVKFSDRNFTVEANGDDTIRTVVAAAFNKFAPGISLPPDHCIRVRVGSSHLHLTQTIGGANIQKEQTLLVDFNMRGAPRGPDPVQEKLQSFLRLAAGEIGPGEITFIGLGCFDHGHGMESVKRQQCPDALLNYCMDNGVDLNIILIDPDFANDDGRQVYGGDGWRLVASENDDKVRQYSYAPAVSASACDVWLTVFSTSVPEYGSRGNVIAGVDLRQTFSKIGAGDNAHSCIISGNFYSNPTDPSQYFTMGSEEVLVRVGIKSNPL